MSDADPPDCVPSPRRRAALVERLAGADSAVEVGVGRRPGVAAALADRGVDVTATDVHPRSTPPGVRFVRADVVEAARQVRDGGGPGGLYRADTLYALNLPPELHRPAATVARAVGSELWFTTLGGDPPAVPVRRERVGRETLFVAVVRPERE